MKALVIVSLVAVLAQAEFIDFSIYKPKTLVYPPRNSKDSPSFFDMVPGERIVGGEEATPHQYPWQAALFLSEGNLTYFCGGSLINNKTVMTAAHCCDNISFFRIHLGAHSRNETPGVDHVLVNSTKFKQHEGWNKTSLANDICLVTLAEPVKYTKNIGSICLAPRELGSLENETLTVSGWGRTQNSSGVSPVLRHTNVTCISNPDCRKDYGTTILDTHICTRNLKGNSGPFHGTCNGDSGGPLSVVKTNGQFCQAGIVSFGSAFGCSIGLADAYTRVSEYIDWIKAQNTSPDCVCSV